VKKFLALSKSEFLRHIRNPVLLVAMVSIPLVIALFGTYFMPANSLRYLKLAFYNEDRSFLGNFLINFVSSFLKWENIYRFNSLKDFNDSLKNGEVDAGIIIPKGFASSILFKKPSRIIYVPGLDDPQLSIALYQTLSSILNELGASPLFTDPTLIKSVKPEPSIKPPKLVMKLPNGKDPNLDSLLFPGIAVASAILIAMVGVAGSIGEDREEGVIDGIFSSPVALSNYMFSKFVVHVTLGVMEALGIFTIPLLLGIRYPGNFGKMFLFTILSICMAVSLGLLFSAPVNSRRASVFISGGVGAVFILTSGAFIPLSALPDVIKRILVYFPMTQAVRVVQRLSIVDYPIKSLISFLTYMLLFSTITFSVTLVLFALVKRYQQ